MSSDFDLRGPAGQFPPTRRSAIAAIGSEDAAAAARAFETLVGAYWRPVYAHVRFRLRCDPEDARDLVQDFFTRALDKKHFTRFDPSKAKFRTYLKGALDLFARERSRMERREKHGGGLVRLSLDFDRVEDELVKDDGDPETCFEREWARCLFGAAVVAFEASCEATGKTTQRTLFRRYVLEPTLDGVDVARPSYAALARELGISVTDVTNHLAWARRTFREHVLDALRAITASEDEFREEARALLGTAP